MHEPSTLGRNKFGSIFISPVAPVACVGCTSGQFREFELPRVHNRINSWGRLSHPTIGMHIQHQSLRSSHEELNISLEKWLRRHSVAQPDHYALVQKKKSTREITSLTGSSSNEELNRPRIFCPIAQLHPLPWDDSFSFAQIDSRKRECCSLTL